MSCITQSKDVLCECNIRHVCMNSIHCAFKNGSEKICDSNTFSSTDVIESAIGIDTFR